MKKRFFCVSLKSFQQNGFDLFALYQLDAYD